MEKTVFVAVANHCADADTSSHVIGVYASKAAAEEAGVKAYENGGFYSWHIEEHELCS